MKLKAYTLTTLLALSGLSHGVVVWRQGADDNTQDGNGDAILNDFSFYNGVAGVGSGVQEAGPGNVLPGNPASAGGSGATRDVDDDFYFEGVYSTVVDGGSYTPVGVVGTRETFWERALTNTDTNLRFHFNVPNGLPLGPGGNYTFSIDFYNLSETTVDPSSAYNLDFFVDGVQIGGTQTHNLTTTGTAQVWNFPASALGGAAEQGPGFDHYVEIRATGVGNARWASLDYAQLDFDPVPEPGTGILGLAALLPAVFYRRRRK